MHRLWHYVLLPVTLLMLGAAMLVQPLQVRASTPLHENDTDWHGILSQRPEGTAGTWVVGGRTFTASPLTRLETNNGPLNIGACVSVAYSGSLALKIQSELVSDCTQSSATRTPTSGTPVATRTPTSGTPVASPTPKPSENRPGQEWYGLVGQRPERIVGIWIIGGRTFVATLQTRLETDKGPISIGTCVSVKLRNGFIAQIERKSADDCGGSSDSAGSEKPELSVFFGPIATIPSGGSAGNWSIGGRTFVVSSTTVLDSKAGSLAVSACARVDYHTVDGADLVVRLSSVEFYRCGKGDFINRAYGVASTIPSTLTGTWVISGETYLATDLTRFVRNTAIYTTGGCVEVGYYTLEGTRYAIVIEPAKAQRCGLAPSNPTGPAPTPVPQPTEPTTDTNQIAVMYALADAVPTPLTGTWTIGSLTYTATAKTRFERPTSALTQGSCVKARFQVEDRTLLTVEHEPAEDCKRTDGTPQYRLYGRIDTLPVGAPDVLTGTWQVAGQSFVITSSTVLSQARGPFRLGAFVEVRYRLSEGSQVADSVRAHVAPRGGRNIAAGRLLTRPGDEEGRWTIGNQTYQGDPAMDIDLPEDNTQTASVQAETTQQTNSPLVMATYYEDESGQRILTSLSTSRQVLLPLTLRK